MGKLHEIAPDGVALFSVAHPRSRWSFWTNLWWKLFPPRLHDDALETVELDLSDALDLGSGEGLTYVKLPLPPATNLIEEEVRRRLNDGDGA